MICLMFLDLLGVMQWAGVYVNAVTYILVVMSIGLLVDFIRHVLLHYCECPGNREEKTIPNAAHHGINQRFWSVNFWEPCRWLSRRVPSSSPSLLPLSDCHLGYESQSNPLPVILSTIGPED